MMCMWRETAARESNFSKRIAHMFFQRVLDTMVSMALNDVEKISFPSMAFMKDK